MGEDWSDIENELIIADYFAMLQNQIAGKEYSKTEHRRNLAPLLNNRSDGSIEFKHQNISAVLELLGIPGIKGYKPRRNFQKKSLVEKVGAYVRNNQWLEGTFMEFAESPGREPKETSGIDFQKLVEPAPRLSKVEEPAMEYIRRPVKRNYLEIEQNNKKLGDSGEEVVLKYEKWRLSEAGKSSLAERVEWVAQTQGDGLGYDILSKNNNGTDRFIEVKTTKLGKESPIFFTRNEYRFSKTNASNFYLYRLFNFDDTPKAFILNGHFEDFCKIEAVRYQGYF